jgi:hypothetical protein
MPQLSNRVNDKVHICGVEVSFNGKANPSTLADYQRFYNSIFEDADFQKVYIGLSSISFVEESVNAAAGIYYKQKVTFRFPTTDAERAERLVLFTKIKFLKLKFTNGLDLVIGRNDFEQNAKPKIEIKTNEHLAEVEVSSSSIFPSGFTPKLDITGSPMITSSNEHLILVRQLGTNDPEIRIINNPSGKSYTTSRVIGGSYMISPDSNFEVSDKTWPTRENERVPLNYIGTHDALLADSTFAYWITPGYIALRTGSGGFDAVDNVLTNWQLLRFFL